MKMRAEMIYGKGHLKMRKSCEVEKSVPLENWADVC